MVKKATAATTAPVEENVEPEFTDLATLRKHFKLSYAAAMKVITEADLKPVHSQRVGKGVMAFYKRKDAFALFEARAAAKKKALEEKGRKAVEQARLKDQKGLGDIDPSGDVTSAIFRMMTDMSATFALQQDVTAKQFELLSMKLGSVEKAVTGSAEKSTVSSKEIVDAIKPIISDSLTASSSSMRRLREENEKSFAAHALANETNFVKICGQLDTLLSRVDHLTTVVTALEETVLGIATAPSVSLTSGEANKGQDFFRESVKASTVDQASHTSKAPAPEKHVSGIETGVHVSDVSKEGPAASARSHKRNVVGENAGQTSVKPRVLILGLHDNKVRHIDSFKAKLDMTILNPDEATTKMNGTMPKADYIFEMVKFIPHSIVNKIPEGPEHVMVKGCVTTLRRELNKILRKDQVV